MRSFTVAGKAYEAGGHALIIAEIGTSHGGSLEKAKELVRAARDSGADSCKFQMVLAREILHPKTGDVPLPGGDIPLFDRFKELELPLDFYRELIDYCASQGVMFLCSPFGPQSARDLASLNPPAIKIASPELNHLTLLSEAARTGLPLILSSGVSRLSDIERALEATESTRSRLLLHCVTSYPAPEGEYNLRLLPSLSALFGLPCGVSDHSLDATLVPALSVAMGGVAIEKHISLSREDPGLDDPVALPPREFARMCEAVRLAAKEGGEETLARYSAERGRDAVEAVLGDGIKKLAPSERANYGRTNRSLHYLRDMKKGERVTGADVAPLRTEKVLSVGLSPEWEGTVVGAILARDVEDGSGVSWDDLIPRLGPR